VRFSVSKPHVIKAWLSVLTEQIGVAVTLCACIREVLASSLGRDIGCRI
jgi:hypothetical protein